MSIENDQPSQLYKITYLPTNQIYIGITWGKHHSYLKRFKKHMSGKGGVYIKRLINDGASENDFIIELLFEDKLCILRDKEKEMSVLYPEGLNGNKGNSIVLTDAGIKENAKKRLYTLSQKPDKEKQQSIKKMLHTKTLRSKEDIEDERIRSSISTKKQRANESIEKKESRVEKQKQTLYNNPNILKEKNKKIKDTKKKNKEDGFNAGAHQKQKTISRYKNMTENEFKEWCDGRQEKYINRAIKYRNLNE